MPLKPSTLEMQFYLHLRAHGLSNRFKSEYRFHPERKWRFDFACPDLRIAVELEGGIFGKKSAHSTGVGIRRDMEKSNEAQRMGWRVFRFYVDDVKSGQAIMYIKQVLAEAA